MSPSVLSYDEAARTVRKHAARIRPPRTETAPLLASLDRVLASAVVADRDQPPFPRSTRDGFACRSSDLAERRGLAVIARLQAGQIWSGPALESGQAIEIMTGAPVPNGADCVLMIEHATVEAARVTPQRILRPGENIVPAAAEARKGATLIVPGTRIGPQHIALAAACGYESLPVYARPRVAILATGDELVAVGSQPLPHQIRNSNSYSLAAQVVRHEGLPLIHPIVRDTLEESEAAIAAALGSDLLLLSGGVSMGKFDFVEQALANLGAEFHFTGARIQPGKPVVFGRLPQQNLYVFGLPGNPLSTLVTFALFAAPLLAALGGRREIGPEFGQAQLSQAVEGKPNLTRFPPAHIESTERGAAVRPVGWQGSGDQSAAAKTNGFIIVPEGMGRLEAGDSVTFIRI